MTFWSFVLLLLISAIVGGIAQAIVGVSKRGCLVSIVIGLIGAMLGNYLATKIGLPEMFPLQFGEHTFPLLWSIVGAVLFVAVVTLIAGRPKK